MKFNSATGDRETIAAIIDSQAKAWNLGDAKAFADGFMADGCFVNVLGAITYGREPFELQHAKIFSTVYRGSVIALPIRRLHFVRADVAIVDIDAEVTGFQGLPPGITAENDRVLRTRLQEILVKEDERWMVASFHNVDIKISPQQL
jgi:uncharacterized protein (TIGR02246 family)